MINHALDRRAMSGMTDEELIELGFAIVLWNGIERQFVSCIWQLAGWPQEVGEIITAEMSNEARPVLLVNLARQSIRDAWLSQALVAAAEAFKAVRDERNDFAHGMYAWGFPPRQTPGTLLKFNARAPGKDGLVKTTKVDVEAKLNTFIDDARLLIDILPDLERSVQEHHRGLADGLEAGSSNLNARVLGWRAPSVDIQPLQCMARRLVRSRSKTRPPLPPQASEA